MLKGWKPYANCSSLNYKNSIFQFNKSVLNNNFKTQLCTFYNSIKTSNILRHVLHKTHDKDNNNHEPQNINCLTILQHKESWLFSYKIHLIQNLKHISINKIHLAFLGERVHCDSVWKSVSVLVLFAKKWTAQQTLYTTIVFWIHLCNPYHPVS